MRQIATLPDAKQAQTLADYLLTLQINTRLDQQPDGWAVWVCDEDQVPRARQELEAFQRAPGDVRYTAANQTAAALRREEDRQEVAYRKRQDDLRDKMTNPQRGQRRITLTLICASVLVTLLTDFGKSMQEDAASRSPPSRRRTRTAFRCTRKWPPAKSGGS